MLQDDHSKYITDLFKQMSADNHRREMLLSQVAEKTPSNWKELVEQAADTGLDNMDVHDLVRMADFAKDILKERKF